MTRSVVNVTPTLAQQWLDNARPNRHLGWNHVNAYAYDMKRGGWALNPNASLLFDVHGKLADGQHRLHALIKANMSLDMFVDRGVPEEVLATIDRGRARSISDSETIEHGDKNASKKVAIVRSLVALERSGSNFRLTQRLYHDVLKLIGQEHFEIVSTYSRAVINTPAMAAFVYARAIDPGKIDALLKILAGRTAMAGTEAAMLRVLGEGAAKGGGHTVPITRKFLRGIEVWMSGQNIERLQDTMNGYEWAMGERKRRNLVVTLLDNVDQRNL